MRAMIWSMEMSGVSYSLLRWAGSEEWASGREPWEGLAYWEVFVLVLFLCGSRLHHPVWYFLHNCYRPLGKSQSFQMFAPDLSFHCGWWRQSWCKETQLKAQCSPSRLVARDISVLLALQLPTISGLFRLPNQRPVAAGSWLGPRAPRLQCPAITLASEASGLGPHHQPTSYSKRKGPPAKCPQFWASTTLIARFYSLFVCVYGGDLLRWFWAVIGASLKEIRSKWGEQ